MALQTAPVGLSFTETMKGFLKKGAAPAAQEDIAAYVAAERAGQQVNSYMEFTLTIAMANLDQFLSDAEHPGIANGTVVTTNASGTHRSVFTDVFVKRNGQWQAVNAQENPEQKQP